MQAQDDERMAGRAGEGGGAGVIGVIGAGTMGAGIAQLAVRAGARTILHDPVPEALQKGAPRVRDGLEREASRGRISKEEADAAAAQTRARR